MVLWSANSSHYFPILTAGKSTQDRPEAAPSCLLFYTIVLLISSSLSLSLPSVCLPESDLPQAISALPLDFPPNLLLLSLCGLLPCSSSYSFTLCLLLLLCSSCSPSTSFLSSFIPRLPDLIYHRGDSVSQASATSVRGVGGMMSDCVGIRA